MIDQRTSRNFSPLPILRVMSPEPWAKACNKLEFNIEDFKDRLEINQWVKRHLLRKRAIKELNVTDNRLALQLNVRNNPTLEYLESTYFSNHTISPLKVLEVSRLILNLLYTYLNFLNKLIISAK